MFSDLRKRSRKAGQPPGTLVYTGKEKQPPEIQIIAYNSDAVEHHQSKTWQDCVEYLDTPNYTNWVQVIGLSQIPLVEAVASHYHLHPLTLEDILNVEQRPKVEEFEDYTFITLRMLQWHEDQQEFSAEQLSIIFGKGFIISFQERPNPIMTPIIERLQSKINQRLRQQGSDYLAYRILDAVIDQYFVVLERLGDRIEQIENRILQVPTQKNAKALYKTKRETLLLRRLVWPMREAISHLLQDEGKFIQPFTRVYLRDLYDHAVQAIDTIETFREMTSSIVDMYLSSISNRMNEIMKVLTIISTIFIPVTFIASFYGMNFQYMPELHLRYAYPCVIGMMFGVSGFMLYFFKRKRWI
jgi:magnesium transporter